MADRPTACPIPAGRSTAASRAGPWPRWRPRTPGPSPSSTTCCPTSNSVAESAPAVHTLPDGGRRASAPLAFSAPDRHRRIDDWPALGDAVAEALGLESTMIRIGVDFGGTKIEAAALDDAGAFLARVRAAEPRRLRAPPSEAVRELVAEAERQAGVGERQRRRRHARLALAADRPDAQRQQRLAERQAVRQGPGARRWAARCGWRTTPTASPCPRPPTARAQGQRVVFGAILGTGCGGGVVVRRPHRRGRNRIGGEWGHTPLPWPTAEERDAAPLLVRAAATAWRPGSPAPASPRDYTAHRRDAARRRDHGRRAAGDAEAQRRARPLRRPPRPRPGGDLRHPRSRRDRLRRRHVERRRALRARARRRSRATSSPTSSRRRSRKAAHGDSSGVRGAAWLWPLRADEGLLPRLLLAGRRRRSRRCPACGSPRIVATPELADLAIAHMDCDAFYASVEKRDRPELRDVPVIVGGGVRGVVTTCCYIARIKRRALGHADVQGAASSAPRRWSSSRTSPSTAPRAGGSWAWLRDADAAGPDPVARRGLDGPVRHRAAARRAAGRDPGAAAGRIEREIGLTVSIGLAANKFLAKIASDLDKPRGFAVIGAAEAQAFLAPRPVGILPGVGPAMVARAWRRPASHGRRPGRAPTPSELAERFGATACGSRRLAHGRGPRAVNPDEDRKAISAETTFDDDLAALADLEDVLWPLCEKVARHARADGARRPRGDPEAADHRLPHRHAPAHPARRRPRPPRPCSPSAANCWRRRRPAGPTA